jgi:hypothetical protein
MESAGRPKVTAKRCPTCGLPSPSTAPRCRCGHDYFGTPPTAVAAAVPAAAPMSAALTLPAPVASAVGKLNEWKEALDIKQEPTPDLKTLFTRKNAPGGVIGGLSGLGGGLIGIYCGMNLLIPFIGAMATIAILKINVKGPSRPFIEAVGVQTGHLTWFFAGLLVAGMSMFGQVAFDAFFMIAGMIWLMRMPGPWPVRALLAWQGLSVLVNLFLLLNTHFWTQENRSLVAHLAIRAASIYYLVIGLRAWQKQAGAAAAPGTAV